MTRVFFLKTATEGASLSSGSSLFLGSDEIVIVPEHKHLGVFLDSKLNFKSHIKQAVVKARRGIGIIRHISRYVSREVLA